MKLLSLTINRNDSTSFYRANGVFHDLMSRMPLDIRSLDHNDVKMESWSTLLLYDMVYMQRPYSAMSVKMAEYLRELGIPLWVDYDDHLLEVPAFNRAFDVFSEPTIQQNICKILGLASLVTVSTPNLKIAYDTLSKNVHVVPNAIDLRLLNYREVKLKREKTILWRGSDTHQHDLAFYMDPILQQTAAFADWKWVYFGYNPWFFPPTPNHFYQKPTDPLYYFRHIHNLKPQIMQVPLADSVFNRCKSNIAWLEGTFAGAVCLVPEWDGWKNPGAITYNSLEQYAEKLKLLIAGNINTVKYNHLSWEYILDTLTLEKANETRKELLLSIIK
jgi:hypothetical protein